MVQRGLDLSVMVVYLILLVVILIIFTIKDADEAPARVELNMELNMPEYEKPMNTHFAASQIASVTSINDLPRSISVVQNIYSKQFDYRGMVSCQSGFCENRPNFGKFCDPDFAHTKGESTPILLLKNGFIERAPLIHDAVPGFVFNEDAIVHIKQWTTDGRWNLTPRYNDLGAVIIFDSLAAATGSSYPESIGHFVVQVSQDSFMPNNYIKKKNQVLPRILRLIELVPSDTPIVVSSPFDGVVGKFLEPLYSTLYVSRSRMIKYDPNKQLAAKNLYFCDGDLHIASNMELVTSVYEKAVPWFPDPSYIVIIHRQGSRQIANERAMIGLIKSKGFSIRLFIAADNITDDIHLFRGALAVIAPHGAGLVNILFTPPRTPVFEIGYKTGMQFPDMYMEVSVNSGRPYHVMVADGDYSGSIILDMVEFETEFNFFSSRYLV